MDGREREREMAKADISPRWSLEGMTALVTGGTKGMGLAFSFNFLANLCLQSNP